MPNFAAHASALGRVWEHREVASSPSSSSSGSAHRAVTMRNGSVVPTEVVSIIHCRGAADAAAFLEPSLRAFMPDPFVLADMEPAVHRFADAVEAHETVAVLGDYDVDGATSTSLLLRYQRLVGLDQGLFHIPQRLTEGYGPNIPAIEGLRARGANLLVIADSGTGAVAQVARAREIGLDVIVIDHHEPNEDGSVPDALVVNPKLPANDGSLAHLCTAGLVFLFLVGVSRELRARGFFTPERSEPPLRDLLGLVALGTVADVVPLKGLNRAYVHLGLDSMPLVPGILALNRVINDSRRKASDEGGKAYKDVGYTAYSCGFGYGPCINAAGRISDTMLGTRLLSTDDPEEASVLAAELHRLNVERQALQQEMVSACIESVEDPGPDDSVLVIHDDVWHPGVVGLGASKVKDCFDRSAVVIGTGGKGSGRGVFGFNIGKAFLKAAANGLLVKGGGHAAAAGLTIDPKRIPEFRTFMQEQSKGTVRPPTHVDLVVPVGCLTTETVRAFELLAPFGMGNPRPRVVFTDGVLADVRILKERHIKARLVTSYAQVDLILFGGVGTPLGEALQVAEGHFVDVMGEADINEYGSRISIQLKPEDIMIGAPATALAAEAV
jgi:single-stranded-DNA-specific exonuclease